MSGRTGALKAAYLEACRLELHALKPGNVHVFATGHGMTVADFVLSAEVSAGPLCAAGAPVGKRIRDAIAATAAAVGCNTNLGIVLLAAPLVAAAEMPGRMDLRSALAEVLAGLSVDDAVAAYEAIRLARPAGLGRAGAQDVAAAPTVDLRQAMVLAASRDRIARQYAGNYAEVFDVGVARLEAARRGGVAPDWAATLAYVDFLAAFPDSHLVRKFGAEVGEGVRRDAATLAAWLARTDAREEQVAALLYFDRSLKERGLNPGTSADLTVASLLAQACTSILAAS